MSKTCIRMARTRQASAPCSCSLSSGAMCQMHQSQVGVILRDPTQHGSSMLKLMMATACLMPYHATDEAAGQLSQVAIVQMKHEAHGCRSMLASSSVSGQ